jgi:hypothetical protein
VARQLLTKVRILIEEVFEYNRDFISGTGDNQMDRVWATDDGFTTTPTDLDLLGGLNSNLNGANPANFVDTSIIAVRNDGTTTSENLQIGAGANPFAGPFLAAGDGITLGPSGCFIWIDPQDGKAPVAGTGDILRIVASAGTPAGKALINGRSA